MSNTIITIILFLLMLSLITLVHEFGHLIVAKFFGVYCKEFAIGMGPKLCSKVYKETEYSIRALPIGGFVSMAGEGDEDPDIEALNLPKERTLKGIAKWKQVLVMFAGIFNNFLLAWLIYSLLILNIGSYTCNAKPTIVQIQENMPAYDSGLMEGDIIEKVELENGLSIKPDSYSELSAFLLTSYEGKGDWKLTVSRKDGQYAYSITPTYVQDEERYIIGIAFSDVATKVVKTNIFNCFYYGLLYVFEMLKMVVMSLASLLKGVGLNNLSGPIGVYQVVEETIQYGFAYYVELLALICVNVGAFNALPIPAFDGGRVLLLLIEAIIGKPLSKKVETFVLGVSWILIITLMVFVCFNDISKIIGG